MNAGVTTRSVVVTGHRVCTDRAGAVTELWRSTWSSRRLDLDAFTSAPARQRVHERKVVFILTLGWY